jgi:prefoldin subunit 5
MRRHWPQDTEFHRLVLDVEQDCCQQCGADLHICDHRIRHIYTLEHPLELCCRLTHCCDPACPSRPRTLSPAAELSLALPGWLIGWDVFCWIGHRRFARHWSVPQIRSELHDSYRLQLSPDAISVYIQRYQNMLAARQQDFANLRLAYANINQVDLTIDGLQPEKGHETLYTVRELRAKRVWFAESLISSSEPEVRRLLVRASAMAKELGKPIRLWMSDKQEAFVKGIAAEFPGTPHLYCGNHFLRGLAKPTLEADSTAKVELRKHVRGLRDIERQVLQQRGDSAATARSVGPTPGESEKEDTPTVLPRCVAVPADCQAQVDATALASVAEVASQEAPSPLRRREAEPTGAEVTVAAEVVLDYCAAVRGILNNDQGGPLQPPGIVMAEALTEVRESLQRNLDLHKQGPAHGQLEQLVKCIDKGLEAVKAEQQEVKEQAQEIQRVAATLDVQSGSVEQREKKYKQLQTEYEQKGGEFYGAMAKLMLAWSVGLFLKIELEAGEKLPVDNLDLERWFRNPKGHERRIHGHKHAGVRIVQEGPTLVLALDAHLEHDRPFTADDLLPYRHAQPPKDQQEAMQRRKVMRKARSKKNDADC